MEDEGGSRAVALVPGAGCTERLWAAQLPELSAIADVHHVEHRRSEDVVELAAAALAALPPRFALAGMSMGGMVALEITRQAPDRVERLALLNTRARAETPEEQAARPRIIAMAERDGIEPLIDFAWPRMASERRRDDRELRATFEEMMRDTGVEGIVRQQRVLLSVPGYESLLASIRVPTLVLASAGDLAAPADEALAMAEAIPGAQFVTVEGGHLSPLEAPADVTAALLRWMEASG
jgi:pimeloyl-ACP methyl ester carboxylesterase